MRTAPVIGHRGPIKDRSLVKGGRAGSCLGPLDRVAVIISHPHQGLCSRIRARPSMSSRKAARSPRDQLLRLGGKKAARSGAEFEVANDGHRGSGDRLRPALTVPRQSGHARRVKINRFHGTRAFILAPCTGGGTRNPGGSGSFGAVARRSQPAVASNRRFSPILGQVCAPAKPFEQPPATS